MEQQYTVGICGNLNGKVSVKRNGLYYHIRCRCLLPSTEIFRLLVCCGENCENLGVLIPLDDGFGLDTKVAVRKIGEGQLLFSVVSKRNNLPHTFVPILDEEPFAYIARLKKSFLVKNNNQIGLQL